MMLPTSIKLVEVSPRDGLQNENQQIPTSVKVALINQLSETGLKNIEVTSFVSPKKIPQTADAFEVFTQIHKKNAVHYSALVPNLKGLARAMEAGVKEIAIFASSSESFSQKNINCSIAESLKNYRNVVQEAINNQIRVRGYLSCVLGCPYEGKVMPQTVAKLCQTLHQMGCDEISLGDTIGIGTPNYVKELIHIVKQQVPLEILAVHFHDTYGQAIANIYAALLEGIHIIDASVAGLGGCPYAKGATGNVATEDVVYLLEGLGVDTGIDLLRLSQIGIFISDYLKRDTQSKVAKVLTGNQHG